MLSNPGDPSQNSYEMGVRVGIKLLSKNAEVPSYTRAGDGACDIRSTISASIPPLGREIIPTGLGIEIPAGYSGLILPRSGLAINHGVTCLNAPGLIDSGYRGEVKVILHNSDTTDSFDIKVGDRIAQLLVLATPFINFVIVDELTQSDRGTGGFGHTGI